MKHPERQTVALHVVSEPIDNPGPLVGVLDREHPLLWRRRGFGISGHGEALRLEFSGPDRMVDAAAAWRSIVAAATVRDDIALPGTGLVAFASFAFAAESATTSVLIVPRVVIGRAEDRFWMTRIAVGGEPAPLDGLPAVTPPEGPPHVRLEPGTVDPDGYLDLVADAVRNIRDGRLSKVVVARELTGSAGPRPELRHVIATLADSYPDCWTFAIDGFLGSSPETLVSVRDSVVTARVLAGSAARGIDATSDAVAAETLVTSTKDQDEHAFAVQNVLASLRPHSPGVVASEVPFTLKLPNLWHLASDVEGTIGDGSSSLDLLTSMHPTAAVAGTPTEEALALIRELEPFDRGRYAGPVGWVDARGDGEWAVALRCAQVDPDGTVTAWAGAGIVTDSEPERELVETRLKFRPIVEAFAELDD